MIDITYEEIMIFIKTNFKERTVKLDELYPELYEKVLEFNKIKEIGNKYLKIVNKDVFRWLMNQYVYGADSQGLAIFEDELDIPIDYSLTLRERREQILNKMKTFQYWTKVWLYRKLDSLFSPGTWELNIDYDKYLVEIDIQERVYAFLVFVADLIRLKPANIILKITFHPAPINRVEYYGSCQIINGDKYIGYWEDGHKSFKLEGWNGSCQIMDGDKYISYARN